MANMLQNWLGGLRTSSGEVRCELALSEARILNDTWHLLLRIVAYHIDAVFAPVGVGLRESIARCTIIELPHSVFGRSIS